MSWFAGLLDKMVEESKFICNKNVCGKLRYRFTGSQVNVAYQ